MEDKELLQQHPLFKKLSGQIVWYMFEERETPQEDIDAFFTHMEGCRVETLEAMRQLLQPDSEGETPWMLVEIRPGNEDAPPCERCKAMEGKLLPADHAQILEYMPPYSVGCRARARVLTAAEAAEIMEAGSRDLPPPPGHVLHCPSEWIFEHKWDHD